jgi:hypothetical protein
METSKALVTADATELLSQPARNEIEHHKIIAEHLLAAAANHFKAAIHLKDGDHEKAAQCSFTAKEYLHRATETTFI